MQLDTRIRVVHVFDISQTEGDTSRNWTRCGPKLLDADAPDGIRDALVAQAHAAGFEVIRNQRGSENGYCDFSSKQIAVRPDVAPAQAIKTLIHELGHALLHSEELPRSKEVAEVEVESVAYIVCDAVGLDSGDYSFAYVARWAEGSEELLGEQASGSSSAPTRFSRVWKASQMEASHAGLVVVFDQPMHATTVGSREREPQAQAGHGGPMAWPPSVHTCQWSVWARASVEVTLELRGTS